MITGAQIRQAREMLAYSPERLARKAKVRPETIERAERTPGEPSITLSQATAIQRAFEAAGVEFTNGTPPGVRLKKATD